MDNNIRIFLNLIRNCQVDNTYKMAWAKALVEIASENNDINVISLDLIARKMFKYYWNQTIYFDLIQGSNLSKPPEFIKEVKKQIEIYHQKQGNRKPIFFEKIEHEVELNSKFLVRILKQDVSWRFLNLNGEKIDIYDYEKGNDFVILNNGDLISDYSEILYESINFRWTQILENFNSAPRIAKKVRVLDLLDIKRNNLSKYKPYLDVENQEHHCFICEKPIDDKSLSIDHLIPWSFLFSDDLWNLVYTHTSCNSKKSNIIPNDFEIMKLEKRNQSLSKLLKSNKNLIDKKPTQELDIAINHNYVQKFWINCKN